MEVHVLIRFITHLVSTRNDLDWILASQQIRFRIYFEYFDLIICLTDVDENYLDHSEEQGNDNEDSASDSDGDYEDADNAGTSCQLSDNEDVDGLQTSEQAIPKITRSEEDLRESYRPFLPELELMNVSSNRPIV